MNHTRGAVDRCLCAISIGPSLLSDTGQHEQKALPRLQLIKTWIQSDLYQGAVPPKVRTVLETPRKELTCRSD